MISESVNYRYFIIILTFILRSLISCSNSDAPQKKPTPNLHNHINASAGSVPDIPDPQNKNPENETAPPPATESSPQSYPGPHTIDKTNNSQNHQSEIDNSTTTDIPPAKPEIKCYADLVQKKLCYHTGKRTDILYRINYMRYSSTLKCWKKYTNYTYRKYQVEHKGDCGCLSAIPILLQCNEPQILCMLDLMEQKLHNKLTEAQKGELNNNEYYQKLKFTDDYPSIIAKTKHTIRTLKSGPPKTLTKEERDQLVEFIKHSILIIRFLQGTLDEQFWSGLDGHVEPQYIFEIINPQRSGSPALSGKNWWVDQMDISSVISYLTSGMAQEITDEKFGNIFYPEPINSVEPMNLSSNQISRGYKPPLIYITFTLGAYNYMVLEN